LSKRTICVRLIVSVLIFWVGLQAGDKGLLADRSDSTSSGFNPFSLFKLSGEAGFYGELYSISGRDARRAPSTGRIFLRPTLTFMDNFGISFDLFLSTEGSDARQQINRIAVHPAWGWGTAHAGDFSPEFSRSTLGGISLRGAGVDLNPGMWRLGLYGGQTQQAIDGGPYGSVYSRYLVAAKIGYGTEDDGYLDLIFVRSKDNTSSLPASVYVKDSVGAAAADNYGFGESVKPQENIVFGFNSFARVFDGLLQLRAEAAGSVFTSDLYGEGGKLNSVPGFVESMFTTRVTSSADYSMNLGFMLNQQMVNVRGNYSYVGPAYISHGLSSSFNDKRTFDLNLGLNLLDNRVVVQSNFQMQSDNVNHQKPYTTTGLSYGATASVRPSNELMLTLNMMRNVVGNDIANDTLMVKSINSSYYATVVWQFQSFDIENTFTNNYALQMTEDDNALRLNMGLKSHNIVSTLNTAISREWSVSPGFSITFVDMGIAGSYSTSTVNFRVSNRSFAGALSNSLSGGITSSELNRAINGSLQSVLNLKTYGALTLSINLNINEIKSTTPQRFSEKTARLSYTYRLR
jgi:hypothetical protein